MTLRWTCHASYSGCTRASKLPLCKSLIIKRLANYLALGYREKIHALADSLPKRGSHSGLYYDTTSRRLLRARFGEWAFRQTSGCQVYNSSPRRHWKIGSSGDRAIGSSEIEAIV